jgi:DNA (cytosine-5)-methyltransferase 1
VTVGSLFAGIGGFDLGFERAGFEIKWQVEIDPFCRAVLEKHWPLVRRYEDVRSVHGNAECPEPDRLCRFCLDTVDVVCGGFPCQDVSLAGPGSGLDGERSGLWFEMRRIVRDLRPRIVVVENVAALLGRGLGQVLGDLADSGYDAEWCCFPTGRRMGHDRSRVFIVAHAVCAGLPLGSDTNKNSSHASRIFTRQRFARSVKGFDPRQIWSDRPLLGRGIHGIPGRVDRVKSLGNSIVPQIAEWIAERIKEAEGLNV